MAQFLISTVVHFLVDNRRLICYALLALYVAKLKLIQTYSSCHMCEVFDAYIEDNPSRLENNSYRVRSCLAKGIY